MSQVDDTKELALVTDLAVSNTLDISLTNAEQRGRTIYQKHEFFRRIGHVMEHPEFRDFFNKYLHDWEDAKLVISFLKTYDAIEQKLKSEVPVETLENINGYHKLYILEKLFQDHTTRLKLIDTFMVPNKHSNKLNTYQDLLQKISIIPGNDKIDTAVSKLTELYNYLKE